MSHSVHHLQPVLTRWVFDWSETGFWKCCIVGSGSLLLLGFVLYIAQVFNVAVIYHNVHTAPVKCEPRAPRNLLREGIHAIKSTTVQARVASVRAKNLRVFFKLNNPFTSDSVELQQAYRTTLIDSFAATNVDDWREMSRVVSKLLEDLVHVDIGPDGRTFGRLNLAHASMDATLAVMLRRLFNVKDVKTERVQSISREIIRLGTVYRFLDPAEQAQLDQKDIIPAHHERAMDCFIRNCCDLVRDTSSPGKHLVCSVSGNQDHFNPNNLLAPSFEAPWRGVFYTLLAVLQLGRHDLDAIRALRDAAPGETISPAALAVVYESLRLYPPIRRIRGATTVDIERIQRDPQFWGPDASIFRPSRFLRPDGTIDGSRLSPHSAWMPFSVGRFKCPSSYGFSVGMIVVVVGEILRTLFPDTVDSDWSLRGEEWDHAARQGCALRAGRDEYRTVDIVFSIGAIDK